MKQALRNDTSLHELLWRVFGNEEAKAAVEQHPSLKHNPDLRAAVEAMASFPDPDN
jgi:hypothetical protein